MVRVLASGAVDPAFPSPLMLQILGFHRLWCCRSLASIASGAVDPGLPSPSGQTKAFEIGMCCFSAEHSALMIKSKDWLARNQGNACWSVRHVYPRTVVSVF
jgi:hypothetical protein